LAQVGSSLAQVELAAMSQDDTQMHVNDEGYDKMMPTQDQNNMGVITNI